MNSRSNQFERYTFYGLIVRLPIGTLHQIARNISGLCAERARAKNPWFPQDGVKEAFDRNGFFLDLEL
jgi:hypothetical protein